ncbi:phage head-tail connector protein, partial [Streptococcus pneumoniae]|nr:phage head-tail connector protein [Streptococcus pneumoniae]
MDQGQLLELLKLKLGISTDLRDKPLKKIISSVITELTDNLGIELVGERADHEMFIVDYAAYRYEGGVDMPRH